MIIFKDGKVSLQNNQSISITVHSMFFYHFVCGLSTSVVILLNVAYRFVVVMKLTVYDVTLKIESPPKIKRSQYLLQILTVSVLFPTE